MSETAYNTNRFDGLLRIAVVESIQDEVLEFNKPITERFEYSTGFRKHLLRMAKRADQRIAFRKSGLRRAAVIFFAICTITLFGLLSVPSIGAEVKRVLIEWSEKFFKIQFNAPAESSSDEIRPHGLGWLPDGYQMESETVAHTIGKQIFTDGGNYIEFTYSLFNSSIYDYADSEDGVLVDCMVGSYQAVFILRDESKGNSLIWNNGSLIFKLDLSLQEDDAVRIAESVVEK